MAGRQTADVVFCIDASGSMAPCFRALKDNIRSFVKGLESGGQYNWDLRLDFLAYNAGIGSGAGVFGFRSLKQRDLGVLHSLYDQGGKDQSAETLFFTSDIGEFCKALDDVEVEGDEATFIALDTALDFPWRPVSKCHRVLVVLTDEALETGVFVEKQTKKLPELIDKIHTLKVELFLVGPESDAFSDLSAADRSEYVILDNDHDGLKNADFSKVLESIGKSVSAAFPPGQFTPPEVQRALFNQHAWVSSSEAVTGD